MEKSLNYYIGKLPNEIGMEIFRFLIPDATKLVMREYMKFEHYDEYKLHYKLIYESSISILTSKLLCSFSGESADSDSSNFAYVSLRNSPKRVFDGMPAFFPIAGEKQIVNELGVYLSVIPKKNGKNRYYLTRDIEKMLCLTCNGINGCMMHCQDFDEENYGSLITYRSIYVGTDIEKALYDLFVFGVIP